MKHENEASHAQRSALQFLIGQGCASSAVPGDLVRYYAVRGQQGRHGERAGQRMFTRLRNLGFVDASGRITRSGRRAAQ